LAPNPLRLTTSDFFLLQINPCCHISYVTPSLTRGLVCNWQLLLSLTSAIILGSESRVTQDHILLSHIRDSLNLEGQVPVFIFPPNRVAQLYPRTLGSIFVASYDPQDYVGGIRTNRHVLDWLLTNSPA
jgi:hypothetical protein